MDPNQCLMELLELLEKYREQKDRLNQEDVQDLVIHIEGLDAWISRGGFLPTAWGANRRRAEDEERDRVIHYLDLCGEKDPSTFFQYQQVAALLRRNDHRDPKYVPSPTRKERLTQIGIAKSRVVTGLAEFNDENPTFPEKRSIEDFYEAVRLLHTEGRIL
jgi:hypothetical protein